MGKEITIEIKGDIYGLLEAIVQKQLVKVGRRDNRIYQILH